MMESQESMNEIFSNDPAPILEARSLRKTYRSGDTDLHVLTGVDLRVQAGEFVSIIGASGSGKSTLLHLLGVIDRPSEGEVRIRGVDTARLKNHQADTLRNRTLGFVFQFHYLLPEFTALENALLPSLMAGEFHSKAQRRAWDLLVQVGVSERARHRPAQLSGGERQRVAVARALVNRPDILLMDEPTGNLDARNGEELMKLVDSFRGEYGLTIIMVTHNLDLARQSDRILELAEGRLSPYTRSML